MKTRPTGPCTSRGTPEGYEDWYDWALVWRYWRSSSAGLRLPYRREIEALLKLGAAAGLSTEELGARLGVTERTIVRWRARLALGDHGGVVVGSTVA